MNRYLSLACSLVAFFYLSSCESYSEPTEKAHQSDQPIVLTSFYPKEGGARDKILLDGKNFGTDVSKIKVYFNNARASVVSSSGSRIYAIVPRLPGDNPRISVVVDTDSVAYEETYAYHTQALVSTVTGNGETSFLAGTLSTAQVYGKYLDLDAEGNLFMSWRDGGTFGIARINEQQNIVTPLIEADAANRILYANGLTVDRATGMLTAAHESVKEVTFTFDPREAWYPRQRNIKYSQSDRSSRNVRSATIDRKSRFVALTTRISTFRGRLSPKTSKVWSCNTRSSFTWQDSSKSPISSKKIVPLFAISKRPTRSMYASVKAPFLCPNISLSKRLWESPPRFTFTKASFDRGLFAWIASAISSLPVPLSPVIKTEAFVGAIRETVPNTSIKAALCPTILSK